MVITTPEPDMLDEPRLVARARLGDAEAYCQLAEAHQIRLYRQAVALCGNPTQAEDLVQQTLVEAWKSLSRLDERGRFSAWLYAILLHRYYKSIRAASARPVSWAELQAHDNDADTEPLNLADSPAPDPLPGEVLLNHEQAAQIRRCVEALPEKHRMVILLRFFEEASLEEIACLLGCAVGTVKSRLHNALEKLRRMKMNLFD